MSLTGDLRRQLYDAQAEIERLEKDRGFERAAKGEYRAEVERMRPVIDAAREFLHKTLPTSNKHRVALGKALAAYDRSKDSD